MYRVNTDMIQTCSADTGLKIIYEIITGSTDQNWLCTETHASSDFGALTVLLFPLYDIVFLCATQLSRLSPITTNL